MDCGLTYEKKTIKLLKDNPGDIILTSSQDGGVGRHTVPPHTTKRTATNLKTKKNPRTARKSNCVEVRQPRS